MSAPQTLGERIRALQDSRPVSDEAGCCEPARKRAWNAAINAAAALADEAQAAPWQPAGEDDLAQMEAQMLGAHGRTNFCFIPADSQRLVNVVLHMIREVRAARVTAAQEPVRAALLTLLKDAEFIVAEYARLNPKWTNKSGQEQDPFGAHSVVERLRAAQAAALSTPAQSGAAQSAQAACPWGYCTTPGTAAVMAAADDYADAVHSYRLDSVLTGMAVDSGERKSTHFAFSAAVEALVQQVRAEAEDEHLLREALLALMYHREQTRPISDNDAVIEKLKTRLWV